MGAAAAAVVIAERRIVEAFELAGATSAASARTPGELAVDTYGVGWRRLTNRAVVREAAPGSGRYYLDREVWQAVRRTRMRLIVVLVVVLLGVWLYIATMGVLRSSARMRQSTPDSAAPQSPSRT
jgi:hypothetical protein